MDLNIKTDAVYTVEEVAAILKCNDWETIRRMLKKGTLKGFKIGKEWRIKGSELEAFIAKQSGG